MRPASDILTKERFSELFTNYRTAFEKIAYSYTGDRMAAEDIVTDCFLMLWEKREIVEINPSLEAFVLTAIKRKCLNWLRDKQRHLDAHLKIHNRTNTFLELKIRSLEVCEPHELYLTEVSEILHKKLNSLPETTRGLFLESSFKDLTHEDLAKVYGLSTRQVKYEISKIRNILMAALKDYLPTILVWLTISWGGVLNDDIHDIIKALSQELF